MGAMATDAELATEASARSEYEHWTARRKERLEAPKTILPLIVLEDVLHYAVALLLVAIAGAVLYRTVHDLLTTHETFFVAVPDAISDVLFVIIVLEIFTTILSHFREKGFQLKPFLIIGIISAVRHVLTVGARLSVKGAVVSEQNRILVELGVNAAVVVALVVALVLIRRSDTYGSELD
jgi:uncharacterized membrane protein (DUF373 family)